MQFSQEFNGIISYNVMENNNKKELSVSLKWPDFSTIHHWWYFHETQSKPTLHTTAQMDSKCLHPLFFLNDTLISSPDGVLDWTRITPNTSQLDIIKVFFFLMIFLWLKSHEFMKKRSLLLWNWCKKKKSSAIFRRDEFYVGKRKTALIAEVSQTLQSCINLLC